MARIEVEMVNTWLELAERIDSYFTHFNGYIFRGQSDASWALEPTLTRAIRRVYSQDGSKVHTWRQLLQTFKANLRGRCSLDLSTASDDEFWTLGQHYGLYTPMLDWTRSPYVAAFFALNGTCASGNRALWALLESDVDLLNADTQIRDDEKIAIVEPMTHHNPRLVSQRGLFLRVPPTRSLEDAISDLDGQDHAVMYKFVFPEDIRSDALAALDRRNINFASLFPDIGGSALHSNYDFESAGYLEQMRERQWPAARSGNGPDAGTARL